MRKICLVSLMVCSLVGAAHSPLCALDLKLANTPVQVCFSPDSECTGAIIKEIGRAKSTILVQAYTFTSEEITAALVQAHQRGVRVELLLDKSNRSAKHSAAAAAAQGGIGLTIDASHAIANNKVMIIDGETVITGSFNFSKAAAEKNAENLLIIRNRDLASIYGKNWQRHREHAEKWGVKQ